MASILYLMAFKNVPPLGALPCLDFEKNLHLTVLPNFSLANSDLHALMVRFQSLSLWFSKPIVEAREHQLLGTVVKIPAAIVENTTGNYTLYELHNSYVESVLARGGYFSQYQFIQDEYKPHVSHWHGAGIMTFEALSLVHHRGGFGKEVVNLANYYFY